MTTLVDVCNRALISAGIQKQITSLNQDSPEAKACNANVTQFRDMLLRMAPWNCATNTENLVYITSMPGTPENQSPSTATWERGQPMPPWLYEYQFPTDCIKPLWIIPQCPTGFSADVPITPTVTGLPYGYWQGPPVKFKVGIDQFYPVTAAGVSQGGIGYAEGDLITLTGTPEGDAPIGAPVILEVTATNLGAVSTVTPVTQIYGSSTPLGGSYFSPQSGEIFQDTTTGDGVGASFGLTFGSVVDQRVILTNQENATLVYVRRVTDPNIMDQLFVETWIETISARLAYLLKEDKDLANMKIKSVNTNIIQARTADGNEGLTVNDITPDWLRTRGTYWVEGIGPFPAFDWGGMWPSF